MSLTNMNKRFKYVDELPKETIDKYIEIARRHGHTDEDVENFLGSKVADIQESLEVFGLTLIDGVLSEEKNK